MALGIICKTLIAISNCLNIHYNFKAFDVEKITNNFLNCQLNWNIKILNQFDIGLTYLLIPDPQSVSPLNTKSALKQTSFIQNRFNFFGNIEGIKLGTPKEHNQKHNN